MPNASIASIRVWARDNGLVVAARGRLPADVLAEYDKAHKQPSQSTKAARRAVPQARAARKTGSVAHFAAAEFASAGQVDVVPMEQLVAVLARVEDLAARVEALERAGQGKRRGLRFG